MPVRSMATRSGTLARIRLRAGRAGAGRRRLRLVRQILDELVPGVEQFLLVDDVVAVEDGAALVAGQEHGDSLGHAGADQVAGGGAPAIVEEAGRHPGRLTGGAPRRAPAADGDAVAVEDQRAGGVAACPPSRQRRPSDPASAIRSTSLGRFVAPYGGNPVGCSSDRASSTLVFSVALLHEDSAVGRPVRHPILRLIPGMNLRLHPRSVAPAEGPEKCGPRRPTRSGYSCNNAPEGRRGRGHGAGGCRAA